MEIIIKEFINTGEIVIGALYLKQKHGLNFVSYIFEDVLKNDGLIKPNTYNLVLGDNPQLEKYDKRFSFHDGSLHLENTNYYFAMSDVCGVATFVLGDNVNNPYTKKGFIGNSKNAYIRFYNSVIDYLKENKKIKCIIEYHSC